MKKLFLMLGAVVGSILPFGKAEADNCHYKYSTSSYEPLTSVNIPSGTSKYYKYETCSDSNGNETSKSKYKCSGESCSLIWIKDSTKDGPDNTRYKYYDCDGDECTLVGTASWETGNSCDYDMSDINCNGYIPYLCSNGTCYAKRYNDYFYDNSGNIVGGYSDTCRTSGKWYGRFSCSGSGSNKKCTCDNEPNLSNADYLYDDSGNIIRGYSESCGIDGVGYRTFTCDNYATQKNCRCNFDKFIDDGTYYDRDSEGNIINGYSEFCGTDNAGLRPFTCTNYSNDSTCKCEHERIPDVPDDAMTIKPAFAYDITDDGVFTKCPDNASSCYLDNNNHLFTTCYDSYLEKEGSCVDSALGCGVGYKDMGGFCNRIRYTPAEAAAIASDSNTNIVTITFKK